MKFLKNSKILVDHMHIPLQSGSDNILKLMGVNYKIEGSGYVEAQSVNEGEIVGSDATVIIKMNK